MSAKIYLGDSVYVQVECGMLRLTTENGFGTSNEIFLEPEVFENLSKYYELQRSKASQAQAMVDNATKEVLQDSPGRETSSEA